MNADHENVRVGASKAAEPGWSRRKFLRAAGTLIALPMLPSLFPRAAWAADGIPPAQPTQPLRLVFCCTALGFVPDHDILAAQPEYKPFNQEGWFPAGKGPDYVLPKVHAALAPFRQRITFIKGVANHRYRGDVHQGDDVLLTCADTYSDPSRTFSNEISCDQVAAAYEPMGGGQVRYASLSLGINPVFGCLTGGLSWSTNGVPISPLVSPASVFDRLFGRDDMPASERLARLRRKQSILDATLEQVRGLNRVLDAADQRKLDELVSAVRDVETSIQRETKWIGVPKPKTALGRPDSESDQCHSSAHPRAMFKLIHAAFLTDSTRVVTYELPDIYLNLGFHCDKHGLNHGGGPCRDWALQNDAEHSNRIAEFMGMLSASKGPDGSTLLDHSICTFGSGVWGMNHYTRSLPLMAFGGIAPGRIISCPPKTPMANVWLTLLRATGMTIDRFADSTGVVPGLL